MAKDVLFRTSAFGGYKKEDVMNFVENLLSEKSSLERLLAANTAERAQLSSQVSQLQTELEGVGKLRSDIIELNAKISEYESSVSDKDDLIAELTQRVSKAEAAPDTVEELNALKSENTRLRDEIDKKRAMERQVGAAMLDARVHSEELVEAAKERANNVTKMVYAAIGETAVKIDDLSAGIGEIARNFTKSVEEVELRIKALTGDMSKTAQALISDSSFGEEPEMPTVTINETVYDNTSATGEVFVDESDLGDDEY